MTTATRLPGLPVDARADRETSAASPTAATPIQMATRRHALPLPRPCGCTPECPLTFAGMVNCRRAVPAVPPPGGVPGED